MDTALDDSRADGIAGETGDLVDIELCHEILPMFFDRFNADVEFRRSPIVGPALGNQLEHLHLARTQLGNFLPQGTAKVLLMFYGKTIGRWTKRALWGVHRME